MSSSLAVLLLERLQQVQAGGGRGELARVDVAVDPEGGLVGAPAPVAGVGRGDEPDVAPLVALADALEGEELGTAAGEGLRGWR